MSYYNDVILDNVVVYCLWREALRYGGWKVVEEMEDWGFPIRVKQDIGAFFINGGIHGVD